MLRCAAAAAALSFLSTSDRKRSYSLYLEVPVFRRKSVSSMFLLVATTILPKQNFSNAHCLFLLTGTIPEVVSGALYKVNI